jgi:hypothetical protein
MHDLGDPDHVLDWSYGPSRGKRRRLRHRRRPDASAAYGAAGATAVSRINVAVALAEDARSCIYEVAAACRALGFDHTATLTMVGVLTGSVESARLGKLLAVPGVVAVEIASEFSSAISATGRRRRVN